MESYSNYNLDDILVRTFMMPAVMPKDKINMINMPNNTYSSNQNNSTINNFKFLTPEEGFLSTTLHPLQTETVHALA